MKYIEYNTNSGYKWIYIFNVPMFINSINYNTIPPPNKYPNTLIPLYQGLPAYTLIPLYPNPAPLLSVNKGLWC